MLRTEHLSRRFGRTALSQGRTAYSNGAVEVLYADADLIEAAVGANSVHFVDLVREDETLRACCDCLDSEPGRAPCRHVWATILAAEDEGTFDDFGWPVGLDLVVVASPLSDLEDDVPDPTAHGHADRRLGGSGGHTLDWRALLATLRRDQALRRPRKAPDDLRLLYVVDIAATLDEQALVLELSQTQRKANGDWGKPRPLSARLDPAAVPDPTDRRLLGLLRGTRPRYVRGSWTEPPMATCHLPVEVAQSFLPIACATGRCHVLRPGEDAPGVPLAWDDADPWRLALRLDGSTGDESFELVAEIERNGERRPLAGVDLLLADGLLFAGGTCARFDAGGGFGWVAILRQGQRLTIPASEADAFVAEMMAMPAPPNLDCPEALRWEDVSLTPRPRLQIRQAERAKWQQPRLAAELSFEYDGQVVAAAEPSLAVPVRERRRLVRRDPAAERAATDVLLGLGFKYDRGRSGFELLPRRLPEATRQLIASGWHVEAEGKLYRAPGRFTGVVNSGVDWFDLEGGIDFDGQVAPLPALLAALARREGVVRLGDGSFGILPEEWLRRYAPVVGLGKVVDGDRLRFARSQAGLLDALLAEEPEIRADAAFARARAELAKFDGIRAGAAPAGFRGTLRDYQRQALGWFAFLERFGFGGCLADDMGLGKTVQVLAWLAGRGKTSLVVAPRSVVFNWKAEAARFAPGLRVLDHTGIGRTKKASELRRHDLVLTTYGTLRRDVEFLRKVRFDYAILDEAQAIKNARSQSAKAARLLQADRRLALSGTPIENHLGELWSLFEFLNPGVLGSANAFERLAGSRQVDEGSRAVLARLLRPFILRRTKQQVAPELPERIEQTLYCELEGPQREAYVEVRDHYRRSLAKHIDSAGLGASRMHVLEALLRLRQVACHPALADPEWNAGASAKLETLLPLIEEVVDEGHKALVFSQFTKLLAIVRRELDARGIAYAYLDGRTQDRAPVVERFQTDPACPLFLISLKAGGVGLNLTAAEYVFLLDPWWNPAVEAQAIDRTHRIGQSNRVIAYRLVARDTVEEKILELQASKRELSDAILRADEGPLGALSREDLELLLS